MNKLKQVIIRGKKLKLPAFFPDATYGHIISLDSKDIVKTGVSGVVVNTYHLFKHNLVEKIEKIGIHKYMKFPGIVISDSGGFQVFSLIHKSKENGKIDDNKAVFYLDGRKIELSPEKAIEIQVKLGSDIIMCLDDCRHVDDKEMKESVERTIKWAERCKKEFLKLTSGMKEKPLLFGIVQGGENKKLRKLCAEKLIEIGFDGYAFGGWPINKGKLLKGILNYTAKLLPDDKIKYAMGVGKPKDIIECWKMGYNLFDCVIPTRDARHKRLFVYSKGKIIEVNVKKKNFQVRGIKRLYNLFKSDRKEAERQATMINLKTYSRLMKLCRKV